MAHPRLLFTILCLSTLRAQVVTTVAGTTATFLGDGRPALSASLGEVTEIAADPAGVLYLADQSNRMVMRVGPEGILKVIAGNGFNTVSGDNGPAVNAGLSTFLSGLALDAQGNLYIAAPDHIRRVDQDGIIRRIAGATGAGSDAEGIPALTARIFLAGMTVDPSGVVYFTNSHRIRRIGTDGIVNTIAGDAASGFAGDGGPTAAARFNQPRGIAIDSAGNLFIADSFNYRVRKISPDGRIVTVAGNGNRGTFTRCLLSGPALNASIGLPVDVSVDPAGNLYILDSDGSCVQKVAPDGTISHFAGRIGSPSFAGDGGPATQATFLIPQAVAAAPNGDVFIADSRNNRVRRVDSTGTIRTVAGQGEFGFFGDGEAATAASLRRPLGVAFDPDGSLLIADNEQNRIRRVNAAGIISTVAGNGQIGGTAGMIDNVPATSTGASRPSSVAADAAGNIYFADNSNIRRVDRNGTITTFARLPILASGRSLAFHPDGSLIVTAQDARIYRVAPDATVSVIAGTGTGGFSGDNGPATAATMQIPSGLAIDPTGRIFFADGGNSRVRRFTIGGDIVTVAGIGFPGNSGNNGPATAARIQPVGLALDAAGNLFISESSDQIRRVTPQGVISQFAGAFNQGGSTGDGGPPLAARFLDPEGLAFDRAGNLYIADSLNNRIRVVTAARPSFAADPAAFSFALDSGGQPATQKLRLTGSVVGLSFAASVIGPGWLTLSAPSGPLPAVLDVTVNPEALAPGSYENSIRLQVLDATPPEITITVRLTVTPPPPPRLTADPLAVTFALTERTAPVAQTLTVRNAGGGSAPFSASALTDSGGNWLSVAPSTGAATPASPSSLRVTADPGTLAPGAYRGRVRLSDQLNVPVTLTVTATPQTMLLSQTGLTFSAVERGGSEPPQTFGVLNLGRGVMNWTASARTLTGGSNWLTINRTTGSTDAASLSVPLLEVAVSGAGLPAGDYYGQIDVVSATAANSPQTVSVVLNVLPAGSNPGPVVRPTGLIFTAASRNQVSGSQDVVVANLNANSTNYTSTSVTSDRRISFSYVPTDASLATDQRIRILVQPDFTTLQPGVQRGLISLLFNDGAVRHVNILNLLVSTTPSAARSADGCTPTRLLPLFSRLGTDFAAPANWPVALEARIVDDCGDPMTAGSVVVTFSNGDPPQPLVGLRDGRWSGTWVARNVSPVPVTLTLNAELPEGRARGSAQITGSLRGNNNPPVIGSGAIVSAASLSATGAIAPGAIVSIFGTRLADGLALASSFPLGPQLGNTLVSIAGLPMPLLAATENQINAIVPFGLVPNTRHQLLVRRGPAYSVPESILVAGAQPAIFTAAATGQGQGLIFGVQPNGSSTLASPSAPVARGQTVILYASGLGDVNPAVATGQAAPASPLSRTVSLVEVTIGGAAAQVTFAGLAPGFAGLYQVNAVVPAAASTGNDVTATVSVSGQVSPPVTLSVR